MIERFGAPAPAEVEVTFEEKPPVPRVWFLNAYRTELIQVQADRFVHNWRKLLRVEPYPCYEPSRERFRNQVAVL